MDAHERVIPGAPGGVAVPARHALAAELLAGRRVLDLGDPAGPGADALRAACSEVLPASADDPGWAVELAGGRVDAVVLLDGPSAPLRDRALVERLAGLVGEGAGLLVAVEPPSGGANGAHGTTLDPAAVVASLREAGETVVLEEHAVAGSVLRRLDDPAPTVVPLAPVATGARAPVGWLVAVNLGAGEVPARLHVTPVERSDVARLEAAIAELERANRRLARERLGVAESAAASVLAKLDAANEEIARLRRELYPGEVPSDESPEERAERERLAWIDGLIAEIDRHKELVSELEKRLGDVGPVEDGRAFALARRYVRLRARLGRRA